MQQAFAAKQPPALLLYPYDNGDPDYFAWCNAYLYAVDQTPTDWFDAAADEDFEDLFYPLMLLGGIYDDEDGLMPDLGDAEQQEIENSLPHAVADIAAYWHAVKNKPQTAAAPVRNRPQRPLSLRQRQKIQSLLRPQLNPADATGRLKPARAFQTAARCPL